MEAGKREEGEGSHARTSPEAIRAALAANQTQAAASWKEADTALKHALRSKKRHQEQQRQQEEEEEDEDSDNCFPRDSQQRTAKGAGSHHHVSREASTTQTRARRTRAMSVPGDAAVFRERAKQLRSKAEDARLRLVDHERRRLRLKIAGIVRDVDQRVRLHQHQEKARKFREARHKDGRGPLPQLGDANAFALGLPPTNSSVGEGSFISHTRRGPLGASPRRTAIMDALTLKELEMLRHGTNFFFTRDSGTSEAPDDEEEEGSEEETNNAAGLGAEGSAALDNGLEVLLEFFTPGRDDKEIPIERFAQKLRAQLADPLELAISDATSSSAARPSKPPSPPPGWEPKERMPCQGRRPAEKKDEASPTFAKVREVYNRRNAADARWFEERQQAMAERASLNAFRASEQERERRLEILNRKELHALRMQETEVRKAALDEDMLRRAEQRELKIAQSLSQASELATDAVEATRDKASMMLDKWHDGVVRSERYLHEKDRRMIAKAERDWGDYSMRLWKIGMERHEQQESITRQSGVLRAKVQNSLITTLAARRRERSASIAEAVEERQQAAAERRAMIQARYSLVDRAFGSQANAADAKHRWAALERRDEPWQQAMRSQSEPAL